MRDVRVTLLVLLFPPSAAFANGGPIDGSRVVGSGSVELGQVEGVVLRSEDLSFVLHADRVDAEVVYLLENTGPALDVEFGFPVDFLTDFEDVSYLYPEDSEPLPEVSEFTISLDGEPLRIDRVVADSSECVLDDWTWQMASLWHLATLRLLEGETHELRVSYTFKPSFLDAEYSKSWYPSWGPRSFFYRLDPAGGWGDGVVESASFRIDLGEIIHAGDEFTVPDGGSWIDPTTYGWTAADFDISRAEPLRASYTVDHLKDSEFILDNLLDAADVEAIRTSAVLPASGGFTYEPDNLIDMDFTTAWCPGGTGGGVGSWIELDMEPCRLGSLLIANGYTKSGEAYAANSRIRSVRVTLTGDPDNGRGSGEVCVVSDEVITLEDIPWAELDRRNLARGLQVLYSEGDMGRSVAGIRLEILEVYPGAVWDDLCVSELVLSGYDGEDFERWDSY
jgi:hypothetical protein